MILLDYIIIGVAFGGFWAVVTDHGKTAMACGSLLLAIAFFGGH